MLTKKKVAVTSDMKEILLHLEKIGPTTMSTLASEIGWSRGKIEFVTSHLKKRRLVSTKATTVIEARLTPEGEQTQRDGLPENQILGKLSESASGISIESLIDSLEMSKRAINAGIGQLRKLGMVRIEKGLVFPENISARANSELEKVLDTIAENPTSSVSSELFEELVRRRFIEAKERQESSLALTPLGKESLADLEIQARITRLSPNLIRSGKWRELTLKSYNMSAAPKSVETGSKHPYLSFLEEVKIRLVGLGFTEMRGPPVETEFWNFDALFQAQDHPAREWSDVYIVKSPSHGRLPKDSSIVENVKRAHETGAPVGSRGWRYRWDPLKSARLVLRPQGTAVSARTLYKMPIPSKYFCIARCYRPDSVDATHLSEFNQLEGISCDPSISFRDLLGLLKTFAIEIGGATEVRFKPDFYPFTSPSVELSAKHPTLGYIEFGGAGIFRPEVTAPFGINDPVIAWGLGVDRLFMVKKEINDIRELFSQNLQWLRTVPIT
ncbi:MAG: phenylalanine--tRNA ligase subunit alpha [Candidatus Heimdallarchaeota archaeon]